MTTLEMAPATGGEMYPGIDPAGALQADLEQCNTEAEAAERQLVSDFVTERIGVAATPEAAETLTVAGGILEWELFGKLGDPLPPGLVKVTNPNMQGTTIEMDPRFGSVYYSMIREWSAAGLDTILDARNARRATQYDKLHQHAVKVFSSTPLGKRLCSFTENLAVTQEERPLPAYMVTALAEPVKKMLAVQYDVTPPRNVENDNHARIPYRSAHARIENRTMPQPVRENDEDSGLPAARKYVTGLIQEAYAMKDSYIQVVGTPYFKDDTNPWRLTVETNEGPEEIDLESFLAPLMDKMYGPADYRLPEVEKVAYTLARYIFVKSNAPYSQLMDDVLRATFGTDEYPVAVALKGSEAYWIKELHASLKKPTGDAISYDHYRRLQAENAGKDFGVSTGYDITFSTREEVEALMAIKTGTVRVSPEYSGTQMRLMFWGARDSTVGDKLVGTPLVITLKNMMDSDKDPFVPGFKLVSRRDHDYATKSVLYEFMPAAEGDPYTACHVPVPAEGVAKLIEAYEHIGMAGLAAKVKASPSLTVEELKQYIKQESRYVYAHPYSNRFSGGDERLGLFVPWVKNGTFETQCSGAAYFMKCSIDAAFGSGRAMVIGSATVPMEDGLLDIVGHNQVSANLEGKNYIIDATPGGYTLPLDTPPPVAKGRAIITKAPLEADPFFKMRSAELQVKSGILDGRRAIEEELLHVFKVADRDALYRKLVRLSDEDPILRSVRCMYEASNTMQVDRQELEQTLDLLARLIANDNPEAVRNLGWSRYSPSLLRLIGQELARLHKALSVQDEVFAA